MTPVGRAAERLAGGVRGWMAIAAVVVFAAFTALVLPAQAEAGAFYTVRYPAPDTSLWYSAGDLYAAAEAWGADGRAAYVQARVTFDVIWPLVYGTFLVTTLAWVWARATPSGSRWRRIVLLPVVALMLDYAENVCTATVIGRFGSVSLRRSTSAAAEGSMMRGASATSGQCNDAQLRTPGTQLERRVPVALACLPPRLEDQLHDRPAEHRHDTGDRDGRDERARNDPGTREASELAFDHGERSRVAHDVELDRLRG